MSLPQTASNSEFLKQPSPSEPPITCLPVNALINDTDPTRDIRALIEQLNATARDACAQVQAAEREKESLAGQLEKALAELHTARNREADFQSRFVEITSLISERDAALAAGERYVQTIGEMQKRLDVAARELHESARQRQDSAKSAQDGVEQIHEFLQQITSLRQARDAAQTRVRAAEEKLARAEDKIADLEYGHEKAGKESRQTAEELTRVRRQLDASNLDRDATARQVEELLVEVDAERKKALDLAHENAIAAQADDEQIAALLETRQQVVSVSMERDVARTRMLDQAREIERMREEIELLRAKHAVSESKNAQLEEVSQQLATLAAERDAHRLAQQQATCEIVAKQEQLILMADQVATAQRGRQEAVDALTAAEKQVEYILHDRELILSQSTDSGLALERQLSELQSRTTELEMALDEARRTVADFEAVKAKLQLVTQRFEQQRLDSIELATRFDAAKREIIQLTANLAETRLMMRSGATPNAHSTSPTNAGPSAVKPQQSSRPISHPSVKADAEHGPVAERTTRSTFAAMRHCYQAFAKNPSDRTPLNDLHKRIASLAERASDCEFVALYRLSAAFAEFTRSLDQFPDLINQSSLRTVHQTIEFLVSVVKAENIAQLKDPAMMIVYAVDDDPANCQSIAKAMETVTVQTSCAHEPAGAVAELAKAAVDLIFLDVNLPGMDGFALCAEIRKLPLHVATPIIFVTGMNTIEKRAQSSLSGGDDFVGKPFNLHELSVKALTLILKAQLSDTHAA